MINRSVPISFADPYVPVFEESSWKNLNINAGGNPDFTAVEIKGFYVIGMLKDIFESVSCLLKALDGWPNKYLPAFGVFASGIDLLGRCLIGNDTDRKSNDNLAVGFYYLISPVAIPPLSITLPFTNSTIVRRTNHYSYSIADLIAIRNYAAHGQATISKGLQSIDIELLDDFPRIISNAIEFFWHSLLSERECCIRLGKAKFLPYSVRTGPLKAVMDEFQKGTSAGELFSRLDWQVMK